VERALKISGNPFGNLSSITATSLTFTELAGALRTNGIEGLREALGCYDDGLRLETGEHTHFKGDTFPVLTLTKTSARILAGAFERLQDGEATSLCSLGLVPGDSVRYELEFHCQDRVPKLREDYDLSALASSTWEGVLYHENFLDLRQFEQVLGTVGEWARTEGLENKLFLFAEEIGWKRAHQRLLDPHDPAEQLELYFYHPLETPYGEAYRTGKLWLYCDTTEVLLPPLSLWSGDLTVDIKNFFLYRTLLKQLCGIVEPDSVAWGDAADTKPDEERVAPEALDSLPTLWSFFTNYIEEATKPHRIPDWVEKEFTKAYESTEKTQ